MSAMSPLTETLGTPAPTLRALFAPRDDGCAWRARQRAPQRRRLEPDEVLYREGEAIGALFVVRSGLLKRIRHLPNGRARIVRLHGPGGLLDPAALTPRATLHADSAIALTEVEIETVPQGQLAWLRRERPERFVELAEAVCAQAEQADVWIAEFSTGPIRGRVARLVAYLDGLRDDLPPGELELFTCQEMGEILGVTPESVSRVIADLKRAGVLRPTGPAAAERYRCDRPALDALARAN